MSNYIFAPSPTYGVSEHPFVTWNDAFSNEELDKILEYCNQLDLSKGTVGVSNENDNIKHIRESSVSWIKFNETTSWIYDRLANITRNLNGQFYKFDLYGFNEDLQYTVYESTENGHYTWHVDYGASNDSPPRKFSIVLQLSDADEYEGGELEIFTSGEPVSVTKKKGLIAAFPSYTLHRVTPVTSGVRKTLVVWACGPSFK